MNCSFSWNILFLVYRFNDFLSISMLSLVLYTFIVAGCDDCSTNLVDFDSSSHLLSTMFVFIVTLLCFFPYKYDNSFLKTLYRYQLFQSCFALGSRSSHWQIDENMGINIIDEVKLQIKYKASDKASIVNETLNLE